MVGGFYWQGPHSNLTSTVDRTQNITRHGSCMSASVVCSSRRIEPQCPTRRYMLVSCARRSGSRKEIGAGGRGTRAMSSKVHSAYCTVDPLEKPSVARKLVSTTWPQPQQPVVSTTPKRDSKQSEITATCPHHYNGLSKTSKLKVSNFIKNIIFTYVKLWKMTSPCSVLRDWVKTSNHTGDKQP